MTEETSNTTLTSQPQGKYGPDIIRNHLALMLVTGIPLLLTFLVPIKRLIMFECPFFAVTGFPCLFCGFTRSIWAISAGDWWYATINCPAAWLLFAAMFLVFAWNAGCLLFGLKKPGLIIRDLTRIRANRSAAIICSLILLNWLYRLSLGLT